jgi:hypothetical protein
MREFTSEQIKAMSVEDAEVELMNAVYRAAVFFERLENNGKVHGNGHHMAQNVAEYAKNLLHERWVK